MTLKMANRMRHLSKFVCRKVNNSLLRGSCRVMSTIVNSSKERFKVRNLYAKTLHALNPGENRKKSERNRSNVSVRSDGSPG